MTTATMPAATIKLERARLKMCIARAELFLQLADSHPDRLLDLKAFAASLGDFTSADGLASFRSAQKEIVATAHADLDLLPGPDA